MRNLTYFVSDVHLGLRLPEAPERERRFVEFLRGIPVDKTEALYMLGDFEEDPEKIWESNIFGKSVHELVKEGLGAKLSKLPDDARLKLRETIERMINDGCSGLICFIL